jgi:papain like protease
MDGFVEAVVKELSLNAQEYAVLRAAGDRSFDDIHSLLRCFPSIEKAGVRLPKLSAFALQRTANGFAQYSVEVSRPEMVRRLSHGAAHPPNARWALNTQVPLPAAAGGASPPPSAAPPATVIDMRPKNWPIRDQGTRGTCVAFATAACCEFHNNAASMGGPPDLSEQFLYWAIKTKTKDPNPNQDGTYLQFARDALGGSGICDSTLWPYVKTPVPGNISQGGGGNPSSAASAAAAKKTVTTSICRTFSAPGGGAAALLSALKKGRPAAITLPVFSDPAVQNGPDNWGTPSGWAYGRVLNPPPTAVATDGHAVCVTGFNPDPLEPKGGYFTFRNSWDVIWGARAPSPGGSGYYAPEPGYGDISATYVDDYLWEILQL